MTRKKTLIALGVSCTLGVGAAAALAASTPYPMSIDDATPWTAHLHRQNSMIASHASDTHASIGSTSTSAGGSVGDTVASLNGESLSGDQMQLSGTTMDEGATLALADQG